MLDKLKNIEISKLINLSNAIKYQSVSSASEITGIKKSKIYQDISQIEKHIGEKILIKNKKSLTLTEVGKIVSKIAFDISQIVLSNKYEHNENKKITISIKSLHHFSKYFMPQIIKKFNIIYPNINIILSQHNPRLPIEIGTSDILIGLRVEQRSDISRHLIRKFNYGFYASQTYIDKNGYPENYEDFSKHKFIEYLGPNMHSSLPNVIIKSDSYLNLTYLVLDGLGISSLCIDEVENNNELKPLIRVLPNYISETVEIDLMHPSTSANSMIIDDFYKICYSVVNTLWRC